MGSDSQKNEVELSALILQTGIKSGEDYTLDLHIVKEKHLSEQFKEHRRLQDNWASVCTFQGKS